MYNEEFPVKHFPVAPSGGFNLADRKRRHARKGVDSFNLEPLVSDFVLNRVKFKHSTFSSVVGAPFRGRPSCGHEDDLDRGEIRKTRVPAEGRPYNHPQGKTN
jgi:hypothetical protein